MQFGYGPSFRSATADLFAYAGGSIQGRRKNGRLEAVVVGMDFAFTLHYDGQAALAARMRAIQQAIRRDGFDVGLYHDDGSLSVWGIKSSETQSGVRILKYPTPVPEIAGADYATSLRGECSFEAEYLPTNYAHISGNGNVLTVYKEVVTVQGNGGPRKRIQEFDRGAPAVYTLCDKTPILATQSGEAVFESYSPNAYPAANPPLWPGYLVNEAEAISKEANQLTDDKWACRIAWNYQFESPEPLSGDPIPR